MGKIGPAYEASGELGSNRQELGLVRLDQALHAVVENVEIGLLRQLEQG